MPDYYEIDFLSVESNKSGDAITMRYRCGDQTFVHVVDGGFQKTGEKVCIHIREHYTPNLFIENVVATHPDADHAGGLRSVLEELDVGTLWMFRPWIHAEILIELFPTYTSVDHLKARFRKIYPNIDALEKIALEKNIQIKDPFQGQKIGVFTVLAPSTQRWMKLLQMSDKTPESLQQQELQEQGSLMRALLAIKKMVPAIWGEENFSQEDTSAENDMSVVQFAEICGNRILLTGDAGRGALTEAADYLESQGVVQSGLKVFDVPHHGSRRNLSSEILDRWLGGEVARGQTRNTTAFISASKDDPDHPRKAVIRGLSHRGADIKSTEVGDWCTSKNAPTRPGWGSAPSVEYPEDQEE